MGAATIIFLGSLAGDAALRVAAQKAVDELLSRGYSVPTANSPLRIYPIEESAPGEIGGGWRPGVIHLRTRVAPGWSRENFLRHELMHEASFRTCGGRDPAWVEEARAMVFSGEVQSWQALSNDKAASEAALRIDVERGVALTLAARKALADSLTDAAWPSSACSVDAKLNERLQPRAEESGRILVHLASGRVYAKQGNSKVRFPMGSLLKIIYAASLADARDTDAGQERAIGLALARSDTDYFVRRHPDFNLGRFLFLFGGTLDERKLSVLRPSALLGLRDSEKNFPFDVTLDDAAVTLRAAFLSKPSTTWSGLEENGVLPETTLSILPQKTKSLLKTMGAMCKTGSTAQPNGLPLHGTFACVWPAPEPRFLGIFHQRGVRGADVAMNARSTLQEWHRKFPAEREIVRVQVLSKLPEAASIMPECDTFSAPLYGPNTEGSRCGEFRILTTLRKGKSERKVQGLLQRGTRGFVLVTDPESYADSVLAAEADDLRGEARVALRSVVLWNAMEGRKRFREETLCDTTRCMVFLGGEKRPVSQERKRNDEKSRDLLPFLYTLSRQLETSWFQFSLGGDERWTQAISEAGLSILLSEPEVHDIRRFDRGDDALVRIDYRSATETIPCEIFRNRLKLRSCPERIHFDLKESAWVFEGQGEGHGKGLEVVRAKSLADRGLTAVDILSDAYKKRQ